MTKQKWKLWQNELPRELGTEVIKQVVKVTNPGSSDETKVKVANPSRFDETKVKVYSALNRAYLTNRGYLKDFATLKSKKTEHT